MTPPINIDGSTVNAITIDGDSVSEVTVDGSTVFGGGIPDNKLTYRWPTDSGSGSTLIDTLQNKDFTINGSDWVSGKGRGGFHLDNISGNGDHIENTDGAAWDNNSFAWSIWVNPDTVSSDGWVFFQNQNNSNSSNWDGNINLVTSGEFTLRITGGDGGNNVSISTTGLTAGAWNFIGVSADNGNQAAVYHAVASDSLITQSGTQNYDNGLAATTGEIGIGARSGGSGGITGSRILDGQLDHPMTRQGAGLSQSVFQDIFNATKGDYT
jgi:hypothetical protein